MTDLFSLKKSLSVLDKSEPHGNFESIACKIIGYPSKVASGLSSCPGVKLIRK